MQYDWIDFYTEFATKLLPFKTDRKTLIQKIYAVYDAAGISVPKLESGDEIIDVDPFTIFGTFNKGIKRLDLFLMADDREVLQDAGKITAEIAKAKAETEFEKYRVIQDRLFMSDFDKYMLELEKNAKK